MASASLVHFGFDTCFRLDVLRGAGFQIAECETLDELRPALALDPDAVLLETEDLEEAVALTRSQTVAPLIYFATEPLRPSVDVDLIIPAFTTPDRWLTEIQNLIEHSRQMVEQSRVTRKRSQLLTGDSTAIRWAAAEARRRSARERERSLRECTRMALRLMEIDKQSEK